MSVHDCARPERERERKSDIHQSRARGHTHTHTDARRAECGQVVATEAAPTPRRRRTLSPRAGNERGRPQRACVTCSIGRARQGALRFCFHAHAQRAHTHDAVRTRDSPVMKRSLARGQSCAVSYHLLRKSRSMAETSAWSRA